MFSLDKVHTIECTSVSPGELGRKATVKFLIVCEKLIVDLEEKCVQVRRPINNFVLFYVVQL